MAINTELFNGDGTTKAFTVASTILSKSHVRVDLYYGITGSKLDADAVDHKIDESLWNVLSATVLFETAPLTGYEVRITVSSDGSGLATAPSLYTNVSSNIDKIINVSDNMSIVGNADKLLDLSAKFSDLSPDGVISGLTISTSTNLVSNVEIGVVYIGGSRIDSAKTPKIFTASKDTYVDIDTAGIFVFSEVALAAAAPAITSPNQRLAKVTTDTDNITAVTDMRSIITVELALKVALVDTIADLLKVNPLVSGSVNVKGYSAENDGGGGIFNYDATQSAVNNGGTTINGWVRQYSGAVNIKWFGAKGDGVTDDSVSITNADTYATLVNRKLSLNGVFNITAVTFTAFFEDTKEQIFTSTSTLSLALGQHARPEWFGNVLMSVTMAIDSLHANGGEVLLMSKRYKPNTAVAYILKDNITLVGEKIPEINADSSALENGTVLEGRFYVFANNFHHSNLGYDNGKLVHDTYYLTGNTLIADLLGGGWDAFGFVSTSTLLGAPHKIGYQEHNISALCYDSNTFGHAMLRETITGGTCTGTSKAYFGNHAQVIKCSNFTFQNLEGYGGKTDNLIIKSDDFAPCVNVNGEYFKGGKTVPDRTMWFVPIVPTYGVQFLSTDLNIVDVHINRVLVADSSYGVAFLGSLSTVNNVHIDDFRYEGGALTGAGIYSTGVVAINGISFGTARIYNCKDGVKWTPFDATNASNENLTIGSLQSRNLTGSSVLLAAGGKCAVGHHFCRNVLHAYSVTTNSLLQVGSEDLADKTVTKFAVAPTFGANWNQYVGGELFEIKMVGGQVSLYGLMNNIAFSAAGSPLVMTLPLGLRPPAAIRCSIMGYDGTTPNAITALISTAGEVYLNNALNSNGANRYASLNGITFSTRA